MISCDRLFGGERGDVGLGLDHLFDRVAHLAQPRGLLLIRTQHDLFCLHLSDIEAQR